MLGAGDAFLSGFLRGWLRGEPLETACAYANACGAFAVSRLLCSPEIPTFAELQHFLATGQPPPRAAARRGAQPHPLGDDPAAGPDTLMALRDRPPRAVRGDGREAAASRASASAAFKVLAVEAAARVAAGSARLRHAARRHLRPRGAVPRRPTIRSGSAARSSSRARGRSTSKAAATSARTSSNGRVGHTIKCLCFYHPDDPAELQGAPGARAPARARRRAHGSAASF